MPPRLRLPASFSSQFKSLPKSPIRRFTSNPPPQSRLLSKLNLRSGGTVLLGLGLTTAVLSGHETESESSITHQSTSNGSDKPAKVVVPLASLIRTYIVYTMCSMPALVDNAPRLLEICTSIPGLRWVTEVVVRNTFFNQFVGGDTAHDTLPLLHSLRSSNTGSLLAYSAEVDETHGASSSSFGENSRKHIDELDHCIDVAADFEDANGSDRRRTWVAVKITALLQSPQALVHLSQHLLTSRPTSPTPIAFPGCPTLSDLDVLQLDSNDARSRDALSSNQPPRLKEQDRREIRALHADLVNLCEHARERDVCLVFDAEYSWYQPAIDALILSMMRRFNSLESTHNDDNRPDRVQPLIYGTFQAYLRRTPQHLAQSLHDAKTYKYALGVKLVRGAYHSYETAAFASAHTKTKTATTTVSPSISLDDQPPVWDTKDETDRCYDDCVRTLIREVHADVTSSGSAEGKKARIGVLFGTHNWQSCRLVLDEMRRVGLAEVVRSHQGGDGSGGVEEDVLRLKDGATERITFGQLYGMADALTDYLVARTRSSSPVVLKWVPYGPLAEAMPYLSRRAIENKSMLSGNGGAAMEVERARREILNRLVPGRT